MKIRQLLKKGMQETPHLGEELMSYKQFLKQSRAKRNESVLH